MKKVLILAGLLGLACGALGQGSINFLTVNTAQNVNGRAYISTIGGSYAGTSYQGQFWVNTGAAIDSAGSGSYYPVGTPAGFLTSGVINGGAITIAGAAPGSQVWVQLRAWDKASGASFEIASNKGDAWLGQSDPLRVVVGGGTAPPSYLVGMTPFALTQVPEPSTIALGLLGAAGLFLRRRK